MHQWVPVERSQHLDCKRVAGKALEEIMVLESLIFRLRPINFQESHDRLLHLLAYWPLNFVGPLRVYERELVILVLNQHLVNAFYGDSAGVLSEKLDRVHRRESSDDLRLHEDFVWKVCHLLV